MTDKIFGSDEMNAPEVKDTTIEKNESAAPEAKAEEKADK